MFCPWLMSMFTLTDSWYIYMMNDFYVISRHWDLPVLWHLLIKDVLDWYNWDVSTCLLTHWGRVTQICVSKLNIIGWDNGLSPGPWFNIKMSSYQYRKSHCGDKTVVRSSYLHNGISYTGKMTSLYWFSPQVIIWTKAGLLLIWLLGTNFSEMLIEIDTFSLEKACKNVFEMTAIL